MSSDHKFQMLINGYYNIPADRANEVYNVSEDAGTTITLGMAAIGNLMSQAAGNPQYEAEDMRSDMLNIGLLMRCLENLQIAIRTAQGNAQYALQEAKKGVDK